MVVVYWRRVKGHGARKLVQAFTAVLVDVAEKVVDGLWLAVIEGFS